jgi:hypothetical protein
VTRSVESTDLLPRSGEVKDVELGEGLKAGSASICDIAYRYDIDTSRIVAKPGND